MRPVSWMSRACRRFLLPTVLLLTAAGPALPAAPSKRAAKAVREPSVEARLAGFDEEMAKIVKDWNVPGIGVGIVVKDKLVFAKGYGYRDYGKKLPFTAQTTAPIASNTKLFTATACGLLIEDGKLAWDEPVRKYVPSIEFFNDDLNREVSIRDMLSHRTGITRHDTIWYKSDFTRKELFERLKYLEPTKPLRTAFLYNNMMYTGAGYIVELLSGKTWEDFVHDRILVPLGMNSTTFTIDDLEKQPDHGVPFSEHRDSFELHEIPYYRESVAVGPAGAINSNLEDLSHWVIAQLNHGMWNGRQVIPDNVIKETLAPAMAMPNAALAARGWGEMLNAVYGTGRWTASYRGHLIAYHGGDINGFHSQVSIMPEDGFGVIVLVISDHAAPLYNAVTYGVYERLLGLSRTPWSERMLDIRLKAKEAGKVARSKAGADRVPNTHPSHPLEDYVGEYEHPAYGVIKISQKDGGLFFEFHTIKLPLSHYHYDRFETPDDEEDGLWSLNFATNPQGDIDKALISLDEAEVTFTRRVAADLSSPATLGTYTGTYLTPTGVEVQVVLKEDGTFGIQPPAGTFQALQPWKPRKFRVKEFSDVVVEFEVQDGKVTAMIQRDPTGDYRFARK
jgi:CubicO group peptidase (beta-lactamase class C family)